MSSWLWQLLPLLPRLMQDRIGRTGALPLSTLLSTTPSPQLLLRLRRLLQYKYQLLSPPSSPPSSLLLCLRRPNPSQSSQPLPLCRLSPSPLRPSHKPLYVVSQSNIILIDTDDSRPLPSRQNVRPQPDGEAGKCIRSTEPTHSIKQVSFKNTIRNA